MVIIPMKFSNKMPFDWSKHTNLKNSMALKMWHTSLPRNFDKLAVPFPNYGHSNKKTGLYLIIYT